MRVNRSCVGNSWSLVAVGNFYCDKSNKIWPACGGGNFTVKHIEERPGKMIVHGESVICLLLHVTSVLSS